MTNERIRKFAKKSGFSLDANHIYTAKLEHLPITENMEEFAELIVKDIADYLTDMANNLYNDDRGAEVALLYEAKELKKRYGVKE